MITVQLLSCYISMELSCLSTTLMQTNVTTWQAIVTQKVEKKQIKLISVNDAKMTKSVRAKLCHVWHKRRKYGRRKYGGGGEGGRNWV